MPEEKAGQATLLDALTTKGTAFTRPERRKMSLLGLLPTAEKFSARQAEH
jgi:malate dehydrogenase (oxaloacetate-decarboxylating)